MAAFSQFPSRIFRPFVRWKRLVATDEGLVITRPTSSESYSWTQIETPPSLARRFPWCTLGLSKQTHESRFSGLASNSKPFILSCQTLWAQAHGSRVKMQVAKLESFLSRRYLSEAIFNEIQTKAKTTLKPWRHWWKTADLESELTHALFTLEEIAQWSLQDAEEFKASFEAHYLEKYKSYFDTIERNPLTEKQRLACIRQEQNQLLLAAAGSGKTSVMVARSGYLVKAGYASPSQILLLAYGNDAAKEMQERLSKSSSADGVKAQTFHSLGLSILRKVEGETPKLSVFATDLNAFHQFVYRTLLTLLDESAFKLQFMKFVELNSDFLNPVKQELNSELKVFLGTLAGKRTIKLLTDLMQAFKEYQITESLDALRVNHSDELDVVLKLLSEYTMHLKSRNEIDFSDMIAKAISYVQKGQFVPSWTHILVDEFQDISRSRAKLLQVIQQRGRHVQLFAVGDDWQAIYRFSGSDIRLTTNFSAYFSPSTVQALDKTFRFHRNLLSVSRDFICRNPNQCVKALSAFDKSLHAPFSLIPQDRELDDLAALIHVTLEQIAKEQPNTQNSLLVLARFSKDLPSQEMLTTLRVRFPNTSITTMTVHAAKGKEADYTIVLGLRNGTDGFPSRRKLPGLLDKLLPPQDQFPDSEERRLFYVALTRAKKQVFLIYDKSNPSDFIAELS
ncbi:UvrD-helicase domain-containing protein [Pseudoalteromonas xiamenensis]|uniref:UvrD-helicase domain-containing protein n=1 Tax=Pseudoalteromonas xiamenensis TaxID=882626 RepID=UPI0035EE4AC4